MRRLVRAWALASALWILYGVGTAVATYAQWSYFVSPDRRFAVIATTVAEILVYPILGGGLLLIFHGIAALSRRVGAAVGRVRHRPPGPQSSTTSTDS